MHCESTRTKKIAIAINTADSEIVCRPLCAYSLYKPHPPLELHNETPNAYVTGAAQRRPIVT